MSVILRNDYGAIAVNKGVIERMIIDDLLDMGEDIILCSKKGKPIKDKPSRFYDPSRFTDPDYFDALEVYEKKQQVRVKVFIITTFGSSISELTDEIFRRIENDFAILKLNNPGIITVNIKGVMSEDQIVRRNIEVIRKNV
ncbi:MAG: hypothetical protein J6D57_07205 [Mogibacterium sp.]|jgi:uncharacterized alkaline shock family protein YloU|nr:hypothetical protein [Mogibacterium sp.]MBQ9076109.1 hypothetical protein [Mogibacterium sp.]